MTRVMASSNATLCGDGNSIFQAHALRAAERIGGVVRGRDFPKHGVRAKDLAFACEIKNLRLGSCFYLAVEFVGMGDLVGSEM